MGDTAMAHDQWDEIISWLKEDRVKVAVLENQVAELRRANDDARVAQAAIIARLDAMRDDTRRIVKEALQEHLQNCVAIQMQRQPQQPKNDNDFPSVKMLGSAVAGAGIAVAALWNKIFGAGGGL